MAEHFGRRRHMAFLTAGGVIVAALAAGGAAIATSSHPSAAAPGGHARSGRTTVPSTTVPEPPLQVSARTPASGATGVSGVAPVVVTTSAPVDASSASGLPTISPAVPGHWSSSGDQLTFTPSDAFAPSTTYKITVPAGLRSTSGSVDATARSWSWTTGPGSVLRLQELLAQLGYLPLSWTPTPGQPAETLAQSVFQPPTGQFAWTWASPPPSLAAAWSQGKYTLMTKGAVMAFEADHGLATDGIAGPHVWATLLSTVSSASPARNTHGYTYALASKALPETLTVWHNGTVVSTSRANTGIPQAPTADGTFPVYERLATQIMRGTNPNGTKYADPVAWVAYFNGGDAVHYIARSSYGSPQSLGCVEVSYATGKLVWPYLTIGSLVTVTG